MADGPSQRPWQLVTTAGWEGLLQVYGKCPTLAQGLPFPSGSLGKQRWLAPLKPSEPHTTSLLACPVFQRSGIRVPDVWKENTLFSAPFPDVPGPAAVSARCALFEMQGDVFRLRAALVEVREFVRRLCPLHLWAVLSRNPGDSLLGLLGMHTHVGRSGPGQVHSLSA